MSILIIGERFFGYAQRIKKHLEKRGTEADLVFGYAYGWKDRARKKLLGRLPDEYNYYSNLLSADKKYQVILVINGKNLPGYFVQLLNNYYPTAKKVLYVWDDLENLQQSEEFFGVFDAKFTYSKYDADRFPGFVFQPFFYTHEYKAEEKNIGISFVGSLHSDRYETLKRFERLNPRVKFFFYLYADFISYLKYARFVKFIDVQFHALSYNDYIKTVAASEAVIELPHAAQMNITTRAIEVLGTRTKLITTSAAVKNYDFYNDRNIFIVTDVNISQIQDWLQLDYQDYPLEVKRKYHIDSWLEVVLN